MTASEARFFRRNPIGWFAAYWWHWTWGAALWLNGLIMENLEVFGFIAGASLWPLVMAGTGALCIASSLAPLEPRLQAFTGSMIVAVAGLRIITLFESLPEVDADQRYWVFSLILHWILIGSGGVIWPRLSVIAATTSAAKAGREEMAGG